ncbi:MAG: HAMP domain-containing protein [Acidobacteria bacterium]|nr:HAMP domain-containing protein [Acidobacteriota bacterium]
MRLGKFRPDRAFLRNKVARQIFLMFVLCALVPLAAMTVISYVRVSRQLNRQTDERLREASKSSGMNIIERLSSLESSLDSLVVDPSDIKEPWPANRKMRNRLSQRYRGILLLSAAGETIAEFGTAPAPIDFSADEIRHLSDGKPLVATRENREGSCAVFMAKMCEFADSSRGMILGEVHPAYLWESNSFLYSTGEIFIVNNSMKVLYSSLPEQGPLGELAEALKKGPSGRLEWSSGKDRFIGGYWTIFMRAIFLDTWVIVQSEKRDAVLEPMSSFQKTFMPIALLMFWVAALLSSTFIRRRMKPIEQLREATQQVAAKNFKARVTLNNKDEFGELGNAFNQMAQSLGSYFDTIQTVNRIGKSLSAEEDQTKLLETIFQETRSLTNADGASLCLVSETNHPVLGLMQIDSLGILTKSDSTSGNDWSAIFPESSDLTALMNCGTVCCPDIYSVDSGLFNFQREFDRKTGYRTRSLLRVPMIDHEGKSIGLLRLFNARDPEDGSVVAFSDEDVRLAESLASQAAVALSKNRLMAELISLFEGLTELIATAVDAKSPHTGDHCKRVPALTMMIAEAACRVTEGPFKDFNLTPEERYELRIAAMLHDCGKVATPVHIVDKSTKLQTIHDRIELIDARFEIILRDKLISLYRERLNTLSSGTERSQNQHIDVEWDRYLRQVQNDFEFLKECNSGRNRLTAADQRCIQEIARRYSWIHRSEKQMPILTADELENLTIPEGTLTGCERAIVNEHVNLTIKMLQSLPLPKKLRNLPAYAGVHHERMDGKGYPFGLRGEQISIQGRMISIADVFEALTAADRPYKRARSVMEAVEILRSMKDSGQIDPDLFDLFVREKLYLQYAARFVDSLLMEKSG